MSFDINFLNLKVDKVGGFYPGIPFWCVFYVRQAIKTAARDLVLHGIVSQSNRPSIINGVRFNDKSVKIHVKLIFEAFFRSTKTTVYITTAVVEADSIDYTRPIWLADNAM
jgi:hypothetical protein